MAASFDFFFHRRFRAGARRGFRLYLPVSVGMIPWAMATGMAMSAVGFSIPQAMGMNVLVFAATAQLGAAPLIALATPVWLIVLTALVLNLRFVIFSAAVAPAFRQVPVPLRWLAGHLLTDGVFVTCLERLLRGRDARWRAGFYLAPAAWTWLIWQLGTLAGLLLAVRVPRQWSLEFMATIALMVLLVPMSRQRPMLLAAATAGAAAVLLQGLPLRLGMIAAIVLGIAAGFAAEGLDKRREGAA